MFFFSVFFPPWHSIYLQCCIYTSLDYIGYNSIERVVWVCWAAKILPFTIYHSFITSHGGCQNIFWIFNNSWSELYFHHSEICQTLLVPCCHNRLCRSQSAHQGVIWFLVRQSSKNNNWDLTHFWSKVTKSDSLSTREHLHRSELWPDDDWEHDLDRWNEGWDV